MSKFTRILIIVAVLLTGVAMAQADNGEPERLGSNPASLANIYRVDYGYQIWRWEPEAEQGYFVLDVTYEEVETARELVETTGEPYLIESAADVEFWMLPDNHIQVNSPMVDGAAYTFVFEG
jgi:hypothetical protein